MKTKVRVAVAGASGYAGEELVRWLLAHPVVEIVVVTSRQHAGKRVSEIFPRFAGHPVAEAISFSEFNAIDLAQAADFVFLAVPHGVAAEFARPLLAAGARVIDLSADFRLRSADTYREFYGADHAAPELLSDAIYGLPELYREKIRPAKLVACPGCYPTSILLPLLPLLRANAIARDSVCITSLSGVTGAGRKVAAEYLFAECNESMRAYGVPKHRHLSEIEQELSLAAKEPITVQFTPHLVPLNRGIITTIYANSLDASVDKIGHILNEAYANEPFVRLLREGELPDTKNIAGTNFADLAFRFDPRTRRVILLSAIDNLAKGTASQAVQCLNLMCDLPETTGLL